MSILPGGARARARMELEKQLRSITDRIESLESAPPPYGTAVDVDEAMAGTKELIAQQAAQLDGLVDSFDLRFKHLTIAVSEGIERVDRAERRIGATVQRARKELKKLGLEDPGLEAEAHELRVLDGEGSGDGGVPELPEGVEPPVEAPSSIRGVPAAKLARVRRL